MKSDATAPEYMQCEKCIVWGLGEQLACIVFVGQPGPGVCVGSIPPSAGGYPHKLAPFAQLLHHGSQGSPVGCLSGAQAQ